MFTSARFLQKFQCGKTSEDSGWGLSGIRKKRAGNQYGVGKIKKAHFSTRLKHKRDFYLFF
jgi:hypothetical protein